MVLMSLVILVFALICVDLFFGVNYTPGNFDLSANKSNTLGLGEVYTPGDDYFSDDGTNWGDGIKRHSNFEFIWTAVLTLIRSSTGESFNAIMHDAYSAEWGINRLMCCPDGAR